MEATNLVEAITAIAMAATAVAATVAAYFSWVQGRQHVLIEAVPTIEGELGDGPEFKLSVTLCNRRRSSIQPWFLEIRGLPKADVRCTAGPAKDGYQRPHEAAFPEMPIPPFEAREATFQINFDWQAARDAATAAGGELPWQVIVTFNDRGRRQTHWSRQLNLALQDAQLHRQTAAAPPAVERRGPRRPFTVPSAARRDEERG